MRDPVELLQRLGFSEYEARAYTALLQRNPLNGYELAKSSGLPRANVYGVLQKLEDRGAVVRQETPGGVRYAPVPPGELTRRLGGRFQDTLTEARRSLDEITVPADVEYASNARGYTVMLEHARAVVEVAQRHVLVAIWPQEAQALAADLTAAEERGIEVTTLCLAACSQECGDCRGHIYRHRAAPQDRSRWLLLVPDGAEMLSGEIDASGEALTVRSRQVLLVDLAEWFIRHSIALAALLNDFGTRLDGLLQPETRATLAAAGPGGAQGGWLEHMRWLLSRPSRHISRRGDE